MGVNLRSLVRNRFQQKAEEPEEAPTQLQALVKERLQKKTAPEPTEQIPVTVPDGAEKIKFTPYNPGPIYADAKGNPISFEERGNSKGQRAFQYVQSEINNFLKDNSKKEITQDKVLKFGRDTIIEAARITGDPTYARQLVEREMHKKNTEIQERAKDGWWGMFFSALGDEIDRRTASDYDFYESGIRETGKMLGDEQEAERIAAEMKQMRVDLKQSVAHSAQLLAAVATEIGIPRIPFSDDPEKLQREAQYMMLKLFSGIVDESKYTPETKEALDRMTKDSNTRAFMGGLMEAAGFLGNMAAIGKFFPAARTASGRAVLAGTYAFLAEKIRGKKNSEATRTGAFWTSMYLTGYGLTKFLKLGPAAVRQLPEGARATGKDMISKYEAVAPEAFKKWIAKYSPGVMRFGEERVFDVGETINDSLAYALSNSKGEGDFERLFSQAFIAGLGVNLGSEIALDAIIAPLRMPGSLQKRIDEQADRINLFKVRGQEAGKMVIEPTAEELEKVFAPAAEEAPPSEEPTPPPAKEPAPAPTAKPAPVAPEILEITQKDIDQLQALDYSMDFIRRTRKEDLQDILRRDLSYDQFMEEQEEAERPVEEIPEQEVRIVEEAAPPAEEPSPPVVEKPAPPKKAPQKKPAPKKAPPKPKEPAPKVKVGAEASLSAGQLYIETLAKEKLGKSFTKATPRQIQKLVEDSPKVERISIPLSSENVKRSPTLNLVTMGNNLINDQRESMVTHMVTNGNILIINSEANEKVKEQIWDNWRNKTVNALVRKGATRKDAIEATRNDEKAKKSAARNPKFSLVIDAVEKDLKKYKELTPQYMELTAKGQNVILTDGEKQYVADMQYIKALEKLFPGAKIYGISSEKPLIVTRNMKPGNLDSVVMPLMREKGIKFIVRPDFGIAKAAEEKPKKAAKPKKKARQFPLTIGEAQAYEIRRSPEGRSAEKFVSKGDIANAMRTMFNIPIRTGKIVKPRAAGVYKYPSEVIRTKIHEAIQTASHELGHHIQHTYNFVVPEQLLPEIAQYATPGEPDAEGFAEFLRRYIANRPEAHRLTPAFYNYFTKWLAQKPKLLEKLNLLEQMIAGHYGGTSRQRLEAFIQKGIWRSIRGPIGDAATGLYSRYIDALYPIELAARNLGLPLTREGVTVPYRNARLFAGSVGIAEAMLEDQMFDPITFEDRGSSLKQILSEIESDKELDDFRAFLTSVRAIELNRRGIVSGITTQDAKNVLNEVQNKKFKVLAAELYAYQDSLLRHLVKSGVVSNDQYRQIKQLNQYYVPFYRIMEESAGVKSTAGSLFARTPQAVRRIKGSGREIHDPLESIIKNTYMFVNIAERNRVAQDVAKLSALPGSGKYIERIPPGSKIAKASLAEALSSIRDPEIKELMEEMPDEIKDLAITIFRPNFFTPVKNVMAVKFGGKIKLFHVDPVLFSAMDSFTPRESGHLMKLMQTPARLLRAGATLAPEFSFRNPLRDTMTAFMFSRNNFIPVVDTFRGLFSVLSNDKYYRDFKRSGADHSMLVSLDRQNLQKRLQDIRTGKIKLKGIIKSPIEALRIISASMESATRVGEFRKAIQATGYSPENIRSAAFAGREVTLDFAMRGFDSTLRALNQMTAFQNAQIRGVDKATREMKRAPLKFFLKAFSMFTIPSLLLWWKNHDQEWYQEIPDWQKNLFWLMKVGEYEDGEPIVLRLPKPFEIGIIFGSVPERIADYIADKDRGGEKVRNVLGTAFESLAPPVIPTGARTILEAWTDYSFFHKRRISPPSKERLMPGYQAGEYTNELIKDIGATINVSPSKLEHTIVGLSGGLGRHALNLADKATVALGIREKKFEEPEKDWADYPVIRAFVARFPTTHAESVAKFYDRYKEISSARATYRHLLKTDPGEARNFAFKNRDDLLVAEELKERVKRRERYILPAVAKSMSEIRKEISQIRKGELKPAQKRVKMRQLEHEIIRIARSINRDIVTAEERTKNKLTDKWVIERHLRELEEDERKRLQKIYK